MNIQDALKDQVIIQEARAFICDCSWADMDEEEAAELPDAVILKGIERYYEGGLSAFVAECCEGL